ncbi:MAG: tetratricopeptide repeat protein [Candidatus Riflebacteria bacterium]|nr:tetratricopeptide repeat protein [Candidatus Riflebacteria bacterium]
MFFCFLLVLQSWGCCRKKEEKPVKRVQKTEVKDTDDYKDLSIPDESSKILDKTGLSYSIDRTPAPRAPTFTYFSDFERKYVEGIKYLEAGSTEDLVKAKKIFEDMLREYPLGEEASIATLCIAEVYFRQRNNEAALELYREILKKYPGTQAAQNAAEGIKYLESFAKHEASFVPPDVEDKKRRRR